jgi:hypothetical protein
MRVIRRAILAALSAALVCLALAGWQVHVTAKRGQLARAAIRIENALY